jgi:hypothetical protein
MAFGEKLHIKFLRICRWNQLKFGTQIQTQTQAQAQAQAHTGPDTDTETL